MVEIRWLVLKLKMSQVSDVAWTEIQEPMADEVITKECELGLCLCWVLFTFNKYWDCGFSGNLYSWNNWTVENGFWAALTVKSQATCILCQNVCELPLSLCCKSVLRYVKSWQNLRRTMTLGKKWPNRFRQYLLQFGSECCMYWAIELTLLLSFCVGVKFGVLHQEKNTDWGFVRAGWWGEYLMWGGGRNRGVQKIT